MGFRSTFITEDINLIIPDWFLEKWGNDIFHDGNELPIASRKEGKLYGMYGKLFDDICKILTDEEKLSIAVMHDCRSASTVICTKDGWNEWSNGEIVIHDYACNDISGHNGFPIIKLKD